MPPVGQVSLDVQGLGSPQRSVSRPGAGQSVGRVSKEGPVPPSPLLCDLADLGAEQHGVLWLRGAIPGLLGGGLRSSVPSRLERAPSHPRPSCKVPAWPSEVLLWPLGYRPIFCGPVGCD